MPNWTNNVVTIKHKDKSKLAELAYAYMSEKLFGTIVPQPENIDDLDVCGWCIENWGTKCEPYYEVSKMEYRDEELYFDIDTAWSPPLKILDKLVENGFNVTCLDHDEQGEFAGKYENGEYVEYELVLFVEYYRKYGDYAYELPKEFHYLVDYFTQDDEDEIEEGLGC